MTYRILDYFWHAAHGARLLQIPADWTYFLLGDRQPWDWRQREIPANLRGFASRYEPGQYDVALLHLDQWAAEPGYPLRASPYRFLDALITDIPKIVINHGLPEGESNRRRHAELVGNNFLVTNTEMSRAMWGLPESQSRAIVPGYDLDEWPETTRARNEIVVVMGGSDTPRDHHGVLVTERLKRDGLPVTWVGQDIRFESFREYRDYLAGSSIFLSPCQWSQHPGARNEAMLCGMAVVSTDYLDEGEYIEHGETGFLSHEYATIRETLERLLADPDLARRVGQRGRERARELFDQKRYVAEWLQLIGEVVGR